MTQSRQTINGLSILEILDGPNVLYVCVEYGAIVLLEIAVSDNVRN